MRKKIEDYDEKALKILQEKRVAKQVKKYMTAVEDFLKSKNSGKIPPEWACSLEMLRSYYKEFCRLTQEIDNLPSLIEHGRWGDRPNPILAVRNSIAARLESLLKSLGLTFKEQQKMDIIEPVAEESPLENFVKKRIERR